MTNYQAIETLAELKENLEKYYSLSIKESDALFLGIGALKTIEDIGSDTLSYLQTGNTTDNVSRETLDYIHNELITIYQDLNYGYSTVDNLEMTLNNLISYVEQQQYKL